MAARFVVGLALVALCHSNPVLISGIETRDGRALSIAKGIASGFGGQQATANVHGNQAQATGTSNGGGLARDGLYYPGQGQALANAQTYDGPEQAAIDIARAQGFYYPNPIPQPILYNQNYLPTEQLVYQPIAVAPAAESTATINGASDSSLSTATGGAAESNAQTSGNYGQTATNAKTFGAYNTAASNANSGLGLASVSSKASGSGHGGFAASNAQSNGLVGLAPIAPVPVPVQVVAEPVVIAAKNQGYYTPAHYGSASSNANVHGYGSAISSARTGQVPARRSISWRFGTAYDIPAGYGSAKSNYQSPVVYQASPVVYQTTPEVNPYVAKSSTSSLGNGFAQSAANLNAGFGSTRSTATSNLGGAANANADLRNNAYGLYRSGAVDSGFAKSNANSNGLGSADANASLNNNVGIAKSTANSNGGSANANADASNPGYGLYRSAVEGAQWGRTVSDARTNGFGKAQSNAQRYPSGLKSADSSANSNGWGSAIANSQSL